MSIIQKIVVFVVVAVAVTLLCFLLGAVLVYLKVGIAVIVGEFLMEWGAIIGILAGLWAAVTGRWSPWNRQ